MVFITLAMLALGMFRFGQYVTSISLRVLSTCILRLFKCVWITLVNRPRPGWINLRMTLKCAVVSVSHTHHARLKCAQEAVDGELIPAAVIPNISYFFSLSPRGSLSHLGPGDHHRVSISEQVDCILSVVVWYGRTLICVFQSEDFRQFRVLLITWFMMIVKIIALL